MGIQLATGHDKSSTRPRLLDMVQIQVKETTLACLASKLTLNRTKKILHSKCLESHCFLSFPIICYGFWLSITCYLSKLTDKVRKGHDG